MQALTTRFVPCADEVWRLQRGDDAECLAFRAMADQGHYRGKGGTRQGIYVVSPAGELLASVNTLSADKVLDTMQRGLAAWDALPAEERVSGAGPAADLTPSHRWEMSFPEDGLVLVSRLRDLPESLDPADVQESKWNQGHVWFSRDEMRAVMEAAPGQSGAVGDAWTLPASFIQRLARFHLVDAVVGQALLFAPEEIVDASLRARVISVDGSRVMLSLQGGTLADADGTWRLGQNDWTPKKPWPRGISWRLLGDATWDTQRQTFTDFELVGLGTWWGRSQFNGRRGEDPRGDIGLVLSLAPDLPAHRVAPAFVDAYDAEWIVRPAASTARGTRAEEAPPGTTGPATR